MKAIVLALLLLVLPLVFAETEINTTFDNYGIQYTIEGMITSTEGNVSIVCDNETIAEIEINESGTFSHTFKDCMFGEYVWAQYGDVKGPMHQVPDLFIPWSNIHIKSPEITVSAVPEFSTTTLAIAIIGVTLGIVALRKR